MCDVGICTGYTAEVGGDPCKHLVRKLFSARFAKPDGNIEKDGNDYASQDFFHLAIGSIYESIKWKSLCYRTSAATELRKDCLGCIATEISGMVVLFYDIDNQNGFEGHPGINVQYFFVISEESPSFGQQCSKICGPIMPEATGQCGIVSNENIDNSVSQDKLYYIMAAHFSARNPSVQDSSNQLTITNCMWVEHEEEHREQCQTCLHLRTLSF